VGSWIVPGGSSANAGTVSKHRNVANHFIVRSSFIYLRIVKSFLQ
jgi:hypothetical protein